MNSCASMMASMMNDWIALEKTNLTISTNPTNAEVFIYDKNGILRYYGSTPTRINANELVGKSPFRIVISKTHYEKQELILRRNINFGILGLLGVEKHIFSPYGDINFVLSLSQEGIEYQRQLQLSREREREIAEQRQRELQERELLEKQRIENLYSEAVRSRNIDRIVNYINTYKNNRYFVTDSYREIAKILSNNQNINFVYIRNDHNADIPNPYNFDRNSIYYCSRITLQQWIERSFLADISNGNSRGSTLIYVQDSYNVNNISRSINNVYLRYIGTETYTAVSGAITTVAKFNIIYYF